MIALRCPQRQNGIEKVFCLGRVRCLPCDYPPKIRFIQEIPALTVGYFFANLNKATTNVKQCDIQITSGEEGVDSFNTKKISFCSKDGKSGSERKSTSHEQAWPPLFMGLLSATCNCVTIQQFQRCFTADDRALCFEGVGSGSLTFFPLRVRKIPFLVFSPCCFVQVISREKWPRPTYSCSHLPSSVRWQN
jgi:hypothetical protein